MRQTPISLSFSRVRAAWLIALTLLLLPRPVGAADETAEPRLDLSGLIRELDTANPEIKAAFQRWESAKAVVPQVQTLPDPRLQLGYQRMPMVPPVVEGAMYGFGQDIPFPGKLTLKGEVAFAKALDAHVRHNWIGMNPDKAFFDSRANRSKSLAFFEQRKREGFPDDFQAVIR